MVDLASRDVQAAGARRPLRLTPKAIAVLLVLARQAGQVVTREQLLAEVWPDTLPTNDVVTQAVTLLRKVLAGRDGDRAASIETIARTGYRLLLPVEWLEAPAVAAEQPLPAAAVGVADAGAPSPVADASAAATVPAALHAAVPRHRGRWLAALSLLVAFGGGLAVALWMRGGDGAEHGGAGPARAFADVPRLPYRLITSSGNFDISPTLSPDGSMVAYASVAPARAGGAILVKTTDNAAPRVLSRPAAKERDRLPAWSPDGREIAFARQSDDGHCRVMVASANGAAEEREVARCDGADMLSFSWAPDGRALLFGAMPNAEGGRSIRRLDLESGAWQALDYPVSAQDFDYAPQLSPNGRWLAFVRNPQMGDVWVMPASGGTPEPLTHDNAQMMGLAWLPDSSGVVFGRRIDSQTRLYRIDLANRKIRDLGIDDAQSPVISLAKARLAFVQRRPQFGIYRVDRDAEGRFRHERLFASNGRDAQPMVSPSGRQIVFASDRSGEYALWWANLANPESLRPIDGLVPETRQPPDWSPDSLSLLVVARLGHGEPALYEAMPALNRAVALPVPDPRPLQAAYLSDPKRILVLAATAHGGSRLLLYDRSTRPWRALATLDDVSQVRFDRHSGTIVFTRLSGGGLWRVDQQLAPASVARLDSGDPSRWRYRSWALAGDGQVHYLWPTGDCATFDSPLVGDGGDVTAPPGRCLDQARFSALNGFSIDPAGTAMYVPLAAEEGSEIGFMHLPYERGGFVGVIPKLLSWKGN